MNYKPLDRIVSIAKGKKVSSFTYEKTNGTKRYIQIDDLRNDNNLKYSSDNGVDAKKDDLIIVWDGANAGTIGYGIEGIIGSTLAVLRIKDNSFSTPFLGRLLKGKFKEIQFRSYGATIPHVMRDHLINIPIPAFNKKDQTRIAEILEKADALKQKRKESIKLLDDFIRSTFLEMFGDPVINKKNWPTSKFSDLGTLDRGVSKHRPRNAPYLLGGNYPLIQTGDIANSSGYIYKYRQTYSEEGFKQSKMWPINTLCITIAANIAKTGILTFESCFPDSVVGFIPNKKTNVEYIQVWLSFLQNSLERTAPESAQKNINLTILRNLFVPKPPIELQNKFAEIVHSVEKLKAKYKESERELDNLFGSLMQRAFRGEL